MVAEHLSPEFIFPSAAAVVFPLAAYIANFARADEQRQLRQRLAENCQIALSVVWRSEGASYGMVNKNGTRRSHFLHDIERGADNQGGNAGVFDHVSDKTDGLMAERSIGDEQGQINCGRLKFFCYGGRQIAFDFAVTPQASHERKVERRNAGDRTILSEAGQSRSRKNNFRILARHPPDSGMMIDDDLAGTRGRGHPPIT